MLLRSLSGVLLVLSSIIYGSVAASDNVTINNEIPRISEEIIIDGNVKEIGWSKALKIPLSYETSPGENIPAVVNTIAYLIENGETLFVAFVADDPNPSSIRAYLSPRDKIEGSDFVSISLDTFNDSRRAYQFSVNAMGVQADSIIDEVTSTTDNAWDAIWQSAGELTPSGYSVEIAIPLKTLRFKEHKALKQWNLKLTRNWARSVEHILSNVENDRDNECALCQYQAVFGFANVTPAQNITIVPALTFAKTDNRNVIENSNWQSGDIDERASLDLRWGLDKNIFLNATVNPDFSQVEADAVQLQVNKRFAIFTPEKRAFFLDGADYFSNWSQLVYTKLFTEPEYGVKVTGKNGNHSYGLMSLKDKDTNFLLSDNQSSQLVRMLGVESENQILRYRFDSGEKANFGVTYTNRDSVNYRNEMLSVDGKYWIGTSGYFKFQAMKSDTLNPSLNGLDDNQSGDAYSINYSHLTRDWSAKITHHRFDQGFRADAGFVSKSNWMSSSAELAYHWYPLKQDEWWTKVTFDYLWNEQNDMDGNKLSNRNGFGFQVDAVYQSNFGFYIETDRQNFVEQSISSLGAPALFASEYPTNNYWLFGEISPIAGFDITLEYRWGDEIDYSSAELGRIKSLAPTVSYQFNDYWKLQLDYIHEDLRVNNSTVYDVKLVNFRTTYQMNSNNSVRFTMQSIDEDENQTIASQLLYSYQLNPYTLFYLGYSDNAIETNQINSLKRTDKTLFVKFSYAWQL